MSTYVRAILAILGVTAFAILDTTTVITRGQYHALIAFVSACIVIGTVGLIRHRQ